MTEVMMLALVEVFLSATPGRITCRPACDIRVAEGDEVRWIANSGEDFKLSFVPVEMVGKAHRAAAQPFSDAETSDFESRQGRFEARIRAHDGNRESRVYKYTIHMGDQILDPIVVVD